MLTVSGNYFFFRKGQLCSSLVSFLFCFVLFWKRKVSAWDAKVRESAPKLQYDNTVKPLYCHHFDVECERKYKSNIIASKIISCVCEHLNECMQSSYFQKFVGPLPGNNIILQTAEMTLTWSHMETMQYLIAKLLFLNQGSGRWDGNIGIVSLVVLRAPLA